MSAYWISFAVAAMGFAIFAAWWAFQLLNSYMSLQKVARHVAQDRPALDAATLGIWSTLQVAQHPPNRPAVERLRKEAARLAFGITGFVPLFLLTLWLAPSTERAPPDPTTCDGKVCP